MCKWIFLLFFLPTCLFGQFRLELDGNIDVELSKAGDRSHFYYNEIHADYTDWKLDFAELNGIARLEWSESWSLNGRLQIKRPLGSKAGLFKSLDLYDARIAQFNVQWVHPDKPFGITIGRFINPFGQFNQKQLSTQRSFIGIPLAYGYYTNISDYIGYLNNMGETHKVNVDGEVQWGTTLLYYGGYSTGMQLTLGEEGKTTWNIAIVNGASNQRKEFTEPLQLGGILRMSLQPSYAWKIGYSLSYGTFIRNPPTPIFSNPQKYRQLLAGIDFKYGQGFIEISGELIGAFYKVPVSEITAASETPDFNEDNQNLQAFSGYIDIRYEPPFVSGAFIAYRLDNLQFSTTDISTYADAKWDNTVWRNAIGVGYKISEHLLARLYLSTQQVANRNWGPHQRTFRLMLTAHL